jgi:hypothetical protein
MNLLSIFDSVTVEADPFLTSEDKAFFEQLQSDYTRTEEQLKKSFIFLKNHKRDFAPDAHVHNDNLRNLLFDPPFDEITKTIKSLKEIFIKEVVSYINKTYTLNFTADKCLKVNTYQEAILILLKEGEGGFLEKGFNLAVKKFRNSAYSKKNRLQGNVVVLGHYSLGNFEWNFVSPYNDSYRDLMIALGWIETGKLSAYPLFEESLNGNLKPTNEWVSSGGTKLTAFKLYLNKRIDLQFASSEIAYEFFTKMQLEPQK